MGLLILILGLVVFLATHIFVTFRDARAAAIARLGHERLSRAVRLVSIVGLALIVWGFGAIPRA